MPTNEPALPVMREPRMGPPPSRRKLFWHPEEPEGTIYMVDGYEWVLRKNPSDFGPSFRFECERLSECIYPNGYDANLPVPRPFKAHGAACRDFKQAHGRALRFHNFRLREATELVRRYGELD